MSSPRLARYNYRGVLNCRNYSAVKFNECDDLRFFMRINFRIVSAFVSLIVIILLV